MPDTAFDMIDLCSKVAVGVITGAAAALLTARLALKRFYHEKWWEKKHAAYNQLIEKLFEIKAFYAYASDFYQEEYEYYQSDDSQRPSGTVDWHKFREITAQIHRFYALAPISLSINTRSLLRDFFKESADSDYKINEEGFPDFIAFSQMSDAVQKLIDAIVLDAKKELKFK